MIMGQTEKDSILFRGNIVYDGDASEATFLHELYIKHNPKQRYPIVCDSDFSSSDRFSSNDEFLSVFVRLDNIFHV